MKIQYLPHHHVEYGDHALSGERWYFGEIKEIPEDQTIRIRRGGESLYFNLVELLLSDPNYKEAESGVNPMLLCGECGTETNVDFYQHPYSGTMLENSFNGKRLCEKCFKKAKKGGRLIVHPDSLEIKEPE